MDFDTFEIYISFTMLIPLSVHNKLMKHPLDFQWTKVVIHSVLGIPMGYGNSNGTHKP